MFYLRVYIWMTQNTEREAESGRGDEYRWFLCMLGLGKMWGGAEWCLPFKCPSSVQPVRKDRQCQWQLVTETAGCLTSPCLWSTARWHLAQKKRRKVGKKENLRLIKTAGQTPCLHQQETNATMTPGWHIRQYFLCHSAPQLRLPPSICPSSSLHPPASGALGVVS